MPRSQNGWTVLEDRPPAVLVPGAGISLTVRPGDAGYVLIEVARRFHAEVEPINIGVRDDWGWAYRPVRGQDAGFSNHASATAIDLNATTHPRGVKHTFTAAEERAVRRILADLTDPVTGDQVVRWGEDYTTTIDGMHFEINADAAAVARVAVIIREQRAWEALVGVKEDRAALVADIKAAVVPGLVDAVTAEVLNRPLPLGKSARDVLGVDRASLAQLAQWGTALAKDNRAAVGRVETDLADGVTVEPDPAPAGP